MLWELNRVEEGHIRDQVVPVLLLLEAAERHLGTRDVLLGVFEVFELREC